MSQLRKRFRLTGVVRSAVLTCCAILAASIGASASQRLGTAVVSLYSCARMLPQSPELAIRSAGQPSTRSMRLVKSGAGLTASASLPAGYYVASVSAPGCTGEIAFSMLAGVSRHIAIIAPTTRDPGIEGKGAIAGILPVGGATLFVSPSGSHASSGHWAAIEGRAFFADSLPPGAYDLAVHFGNCCGIVSTVRVVAGNTTVAALSVAQYYNQLFGELARNRYLDSFSVAPDGRPWFVENLGVEDRIATLDASGRLVEFAVEGGGGTVRSIAPAADGSVWFFDSFESRFARLDSNGRVSLYGDRTSFRGSLVAAGDGAAWAIQWHGGAFYRIDSHSATVRAFALPSPQPYDDSVDLAALPDGSAIYTSRRTNSAYHAGIDGAIVAKKFDWLCEPRAPLAWAGGVAVSCAAGPYRGAIADPDLHALTPIVSESEDYGAAFIPAALVERGGRLWYGSTKLGGFAGIDPSRSRSFISFGGQITNYLTASNDLLWFVDYAANQMISLSPSGSVAKYQLPELKRADGSIQPIFPVAGSDGTVWFSAETSMVVYRLRPGDAVVQAIPIRPAPLRMPQ